MNWFLSIASCIHQKEMTEEGCMESDLQSTTPFGEALGLQFDDIDFENRLIHVQRSYSKSRIDTPKKWKIKRCGYVFTTDGNSERIEREKRG
jgi:hypothetical protein